MASRGSICKALLRWAPLITLTAASVMHTHAQAQAPPYKVVAPDGKVTYTDRPTAASGSTVSTLTVRSGNSDGPGLPLELRQATTRYPVILYTSIDDCEPCVAARQLLRLRGIPHTEKQVQSAEDRVALERLSGSLDLPTLGIGAQLLRGLSAEVWNAYLDAAGYARDSRLPANYQYLPATPLVARTPLRLPAPQGPDNLPAAPTQAPPLILARPDPSGIRF